MAAADAERMPELTAAELRELLVEVAAALALAIGDMHSEARRKHCRDLVEKVAARLYPHTGS